MRLHRLFILTTALASLIFCSCGGHFTSDEATRSKIHEKFESRRAQFTEGDIFGIFDKHLSTAEREAMEFLYAYMTSADMGDYEGEYFLDNVRMSLKARRQMAWGEQIPEDIFRHFVVPIRVNNERLDDFRMIYYDTLRKRVEGMSLHDAALEVNHWCHEKVTYVPSDSRTSSPLATMCNAEGRCGEESTFTVAAMRAIGIPARQVYTPRWAHTDSNHAWVEVWIDGKWYFLGACEPEPALNVAWFNQPAARAMLMHTRVYGDYEGPEDVIQRTECFTEINVIDNYAPTRKSVVTITDTEGKPVAGATVEFKIFNYGDFTTVVTLPSNEKGEVSLHTGLGDMLVWARHNGRFGFAKLNTEKLNVPLQYKEGDAIKYIDDITPPVPGEIPVNLTEDAIAKNKIRLAYEDSIRLAYVATFLKPEQCKEYNRSEQSLLIGARGNWPAIKAFLDNNSGDKRQKAVAILRTISRKDLHDTSLEVLQDALDSSLDGELTPEYTRYVLSPRISSEFLQPYRTVIRETLSKELGATPTGADIIKWTKQNITLADDYNPIALQATPAGVLRLRKADTDSRNRFFVAACRTFGIAARMGGMTGSPQYKNGERWVDVALDGEVSERVPKMGSLRTFYDRKVIPTMPNPQFTISRIENGECRPIRFSRGSDIDLGPNSSADLLAREFQLEEGYYMLTTGNRMASGKILSHNTTFTIEEGKTTKVDLVVRPANDDIGVIGSMDAERKYMPDGGSSELSILSTTGRGYFIVAVMGTSDEPTNHATRGLASIAGTLNEWNRPIVLLNATPEDAAKFNRGALAALKTINYGTDPANKVRQMLCSGCNSQSPTLPVIAICDSFGRIVYFSQGYNTSLAEQLKSVIHKL